MSEEAVHTGESASLSFRWHCVSLPWLGFGSCLVWMKIIGWSDWREGLEVQRTSIQ